MQINGWLYIDALWEFGIDCAGFLMDDGLTAEAGWIKMCQFRISAQLAPALYSSTNDNMAYQPNSERRTENES